MDPWTASDSESLPANLYPDTSSSTQVLLDNLPSARRFRASLNT